MHRGTVGSCVPRFARVEFRNACRQAPPASLELRGSLRRERGSTSLVVCRLGGGALVGIFAGHSWGSRLGGAVLGESSWKGPQAVRSSWGSRLGGVVLEVVVCKIPMGPNESLWNPIDPYGIYPIASLYHHRHRHHLRHHYCYHHSTPNHHPSCSSG